MRKRTSTRRPPGIVVGQEVGRQLNVRTMFAERKDGKMQPAAASRSPGEKVLICEDVVTTGGSIEEVITIVRASGGLPVGVAAIVDRSGGKASFENFFSPLAMDAVTHEAAACPLCAKGVPIDRPGSRSQR